MTELEVERDRRKTAEMRLALVISRLEKLRDSWIREVGYDNNGRARMIHRLRQYYALELKSELAQALLEAQRLEYVSVRT